MIRAMVRTVSRGIGAEVRDLTPRRADTTAVIGSALLASARGTRGTGGSPPNSTGRCPPCGAGADTYRVS